MRPFRTQAHVCFSNRPFEVKRFQTIHDTAVEVARGLVLLYGIGNRPSIMGSFSGRYWGDTGAKVVLHR
jgi:hypothetical protein